MKKWICMFAVALSVSCTLAQQYAVYVEPNCSDVDINSVDLSGNIHTETANVLENPQVSFYFKNMSGTTKDVTISRAALCVPPEWMNELIWEPACTDPSFEGVHYSEAQIDNSWESMSITIPNDSLGRLASTIDFNGGPTDGIYRYYFRSNGIILDSVDLKINGGCILGIGEKGQEVGMSVFPNPVDNELTVSTFGLSGNSVLCITDVSGKVVYESLVTDLQRIQTSAFHSGVYFISILENGVVLHTQRMLVKH